MNGRANTDTGKGLYEGRLLCGVGGSRGSLGRGGACLGLREVVDKGRDEVCDDRWVTGIRPAPFQDLRGVHARLVLL
ncbi:hypothetical protein E2C01_002014 [Portunus trituberculatus]|uniref:Uncharacterized protein n=1 Tax=Portunus trituberculatus TaxID=210409 RepID=A0A5B7CP76_PORTR|nr:hypothetical protein [Portunus trituberculatus]